VRLVTCAGATIAAAALAGCGGSSGHTWGGPPAPAADGTVSVEAFEAHRETVEEPWESSPALVAAEFVRLGERTAVNTSIETSSESEGSSPTVTITLDGLLDDSVRAERWVLELEPAGGDGFRLVSVRRTQRCQPDRGHEGFSAERCS